MSHPISNPLEVHSGNPTAGTAVTPLAAALQASASLRDYRGAQTASFFSSASEELAALLTRAGVYDLGWRTFLRCSGEDRVRWLNGMVTNSVNGLEENSGCYAFVLNAQGRIQGDIDIYRRVDSLWLQTDRAQIETLAAFLDHYIIMDDVVLEPAQGWTAIGIAGPDAANKLAAVGLPVAALSPMHLTEAVWRDHPVVLVAAHSPRVPRYEIWTAQDRVLDLWKMLVDAGAAPCGADALEQLRILEGTPAYSIDITNRDLPQETNQMRALHFAKGCYLGQEIVERIRSRGNVHRAFRGFVVESGDPAAKTPILAESQPVGELTSVARISIPGIGEKVLALGHIRREALDRKTGLTADAQPVTPAALPFDFASTAVQP